MTSHIKLSLYLDLTDTRLWVETGWIPKCPRHLFRTLPVWTIWTSTVWRRTTTLVEVKVSTMQQLVINSSFWTLTFYLELQYVLLFQLLILSLETCRVFWLNLVVHFKPILEHSYPRYFIRLGVRFGYETNCLINYFYLLEVFCSDRECNSLLVTLKLFKLRINGRTLEFFILINKLIGWDLTNNILKIAFKSRMWSV